MHIYALLYAFMGSVYVGSLELGLGLQVVVSNCVAVGSESSYSVRTVLLPTEPSCHHPYPPSPLKMEDLI